MGFSILFTSIVYSSVIMILEYFILCLKHAALLRDFILIEFEVGSSTTDVTNPIAISQALTFLKRHFDCLSIWQLTGSDKIFIYEENERVGFECIIRYIFYKG